jgi:hypothetical protein
MWIANSSGVKRDKRPQQPKRAGNTRSVSKNHGRVQRVTKENVEAVAELEKEPEWLLTKYTISGLLGYY